MMRRDDTGPLADSVRSAVRRREGVAVLERRDAEAAAERRSRGIRASCYDPSVVRAYMHLVQFLIAEGKPQMTGFIMVEPAGLAGWHAFAVPSGIDDKHYYARGGA
jgi:hypothetical protein